MYISLQTYSGLIKSNRDIDHYTLTPGFKPGTHRSTFNGVPVMIQVSNIGSTVKFLDFWMPENFAVIYLKFKQRGQILLGYFVKKM